MEKDIYSFKSLWQRVLLRALADATYHGTSSHVTPIDRDSARSFLVTDSRDLRTVCEMAGIHHEDVLNRARGLEETDWPRK